MPQEESKLTEKEESKQEEEPKFELGSIEDQISRTVVVRGYPQGFTSLEFEDMFLSCGKIEKILFGIKEVKIIFHNKLG